MPYSGICEKSVKNSGQICAHHPCSFVVVTADVTKASIDWGHTRLVFSRVAFTLSVQNKAILHLLHTVSKTKKAHGAKIVAQQYSSCLACARLWVCSLELQTAKEAEFTNSKPKPPRYGNSSWGQFWLAGETLPCFQKYIIMTLDIFVTSFFFSFCQELLVLYCHRMTLKTSCLHRPGEARKFLPRWSSSWNSTSFLLKRWSMKGHQQVLSPGG